MPLSIISNYAAGVVHRHVERNDMLAGRMVARIASGSRVVYARDDATSLMVGTRLRADVGSMQMAAVNASHAAAVLQVADGAAEVVADMTIRLKTLAVQSASDQLTSNERQMIDGEYQQLLREMDRISHAASFNGKRVLSFTGDKIVPAGLRDGGDHAFSGQNGIVSIDTSGAMAGSMFAGSFDHAKNALTLVNLSTGERETETLSFRTLDDQERETVKFLSLGVTLQIDQKFRKQNMGAASNGAYSTGVSWLGLNANVSTDSAYGPALTQLLPTSDTALDDQAWLERLHVSDLRMRALPSFAKLDVPFQEIRLSTSADVPLMATLIDYASPQVEVRELPITTVSSTTTYDVSIGSSTFSATGVATLAGLAAAFNALTSPSAPPFTAEVAYHRDGSEAGLRLSWNSPGTIGSVAASETPSGGTAAAIAARVLQTGSPGAGFEIHEIALAAPTSTTAYDITIGSDTFSATGASTLAGLATAFNGLTSPSAPPFTATIAYDADGAETGLRLTWNEVGDVEEVSVSATPSGGTAAALTTTPVQRGGDTSQGRKYEVDLGLSADRTSLRAENGTKGRDTSLAGGTGEPKLFTRVQIRTAEGLHRPMTADQAHLSLKDGDMVTVTLHNGETGAGSQEYMEFSFRISNVDRLSTLTSSLAATGSTAPVAAILLNSHRMFAVSGQESDGTPFSFQVGGTTLASDTLSFRLPALTSRSLGIADTNVRTAGAARIAMSAVDAAINGAARVRGEIGAIQNRFEFTEANLRTMAENTEQGRSELMDLDVASEMTKLTSQQILVQAGVSMLAQANQMPQQLMRLFQ